MTIEDAARSGQGGEEGFYYNVRVKVIPRLVERGLLNGKSVEGVPHVAIDETFERRMSFGIERFVYNTQGWSFVAFDSPFDRVAAALRSLRGVSGYRAGVAAERWVEEDARMQPDPARRDVFLIQPRGAAWPVLVQTVHWIQGSDPLLATWIAAEVSQALGARAVSAWDDDFSSATGVICDRGERSGGVSDSGEWVDFYLYFYEQGIRVPKCFIASGEAAAAAARLLVEDPAEVERADGMTIAIPDESQVRVPHVFSKIGMMAEAIAEGLEDEAAFHQRAADSLWGRVQGLRGR
jgi:hypothetical protein